MPDRIEETLSALRVDIDRVGLPDSGSIRRRGDQRTRHQVIGTTLAALAVVAGAIGVTANLTGDDRSLQGPPAEQPSVSTTQQPLLTLADDPLLRPDDIGTIGVYEGWKRSPEAVSESLRPLRCVTSPTTWGAQRTEGAQYYQDLDAMVVEHVLRFPDVASAEAGLQLGLSQYAACGTGDPAQETVAQRPQEAVPGAGDDAYRASRLVTPKADAGIAYYELAVARTNNVVAVLEWTSMGNPYGDDSADWVWTADRLQTALDRAVD